MMFEQGIFDFDPRRHWMKEGHDIQPPSTIIAAPELGTVKERLLAAIAAAPQIDARAASQARSFEKRFPRAFKLLERCWSGPFPQGPFDEAARMNPFDKRRVVEGSFNNIGRHCIWVAFFADVVCEECVEAGLLSNEQQAAIVEEALLHDATKFLEILRRQASIPFLEIEYAVLATEDRQILTSDPFHLTVEEAGKLIEVGAYTGGIEGFRRFLGADLDGVVFLEGDLEKRIVRLADDMTLSTALSAGFPEATLFMPASRKNYFNALKYVRELYLTGLAVRVSDRRLVALELARGVPNGLVLLGSLAWLQDLIAQDTCRLLARALQPSGESEPSQYVVDLVNRKAFALSG